MFFICVFLVNALTHGHENFQFKNITLSNCKFYVLLGYSYVLKKIRKLTQLVEQIKYAM